MPKRPRPQQAHQFVTAPTWLLLAGVSPVSVGLYCLLKAHADADTGIAKVRHYDLADMLGYSRGDKVNPYLRELSVVGAIAVVRAPSKAPAEYLVRETPPEGYAGPRTIAEWQDAQVAA